MPLSNAQIAILQNPEVRKRLPAKNSEFVYADKLISTIGKECPRLPAVWERVFQGLDASTATWLNTRYPGHQFKTSGFTSSTTTPTPDPGVRSIVHRAIEVLQSYQKSP